MTRSRGWAGSRRLRRPGRGLTVPAAVVVMTAGLAVPAGAAVAVPSPDRPGGPGVTAPRAHAAAHGSAQAGVRQPMTRFSRTVRHANGRYTTTIYPGPVNYRTAAGWRPIDSALVPAGAAGFAWRNKANS